MYNERNNINRKSIKKYYEIRARYDAYPHDKHWVTTESGHHILIDDDGNIVSGNIEVIKAINSKKTPTVKIPKSEYGKVMSEINTNFSSKYKSKIGKTAGVYCNGRYYRFEVYGFNEYRFIMMAPISSDMDVIYEMRDLFDE